MEVRLRVIHFSKKMLGTCSQASTAKVYNSACLHVATAKVCDCAFLHDMVASQSVPQITQHMCVIQQKQAVSLD